MSNSSSSSGILENSRSTNRGNDHLDVYISTKDVDENGAIEEAIKLSHQLIQQGLTVCIIENRKLESNKRFAFDQILLAKLVVIMATDDYGTRNSESRTELKFIVEARKPSILIKMTETLSFRSMEGVKVMEWVRGEDKSIPVAMLIYDKLQSISLNMGKLGIIIFPSSCLHFFLYLKKSFVS